MVMKIYVLMLLHAPSKELHSPDRLSLPKRLCPLAKVLHSPTKLCAVSQNVCTLSQNKFPEKLSHAKQNYRYVCPVRQNM